MSTVQIALVVNSEDDAGKSKVFDLADDFDTVIGRLYPLQQPSSALEHRSNMTHTKTDGGRLVIHPQNVAWIEEVIE